MLGLAQVKPGRIKKHDQRITNTYLPAWRLPMPQI